MKRKRKRKAITAREMEAAHRLCLERERIRERDWRETRQGAFESTILHLDFEAEEALEREGSTSWLSDRGRGARQIARPLLTSPEEFAGMVKEAEEKGLPPPKPKPTREQLVNKARMAIIRHMPECLKTFRLVLKNETNWKESVWELMKSTTSKTLPNGRRRKPSTLHSSKKS